MIVYQPADVLDKGFLFCFVPCFPAVVRTVSQEMVNSMDISKKLYKYY